MKWDKETLGQICDREGGIIQTGPFGSQLHQSDYREEGIPVVMPQDIVGGRINLSSVARVAEETADKLGRHKLKIGAIIMPRRGEISKRAFIRESEQGWLCGTGCIKIELVGTILEPRFLYYYLEEPQVAGWIEQHAVGTTMLNLNTTIIREIPVRFPCLDIQHKTVSLLSGYDDLMENNQRRMALIEESARQLYHEWFVRLRFPGYEHTHITDGVPEGWELRTLADACESAENGDWIESKDQDGDDFRLLQISNIGANEFIETNNVRDISEDAFRRLNCRAIEPDDILISRMPKPIGRAWLVTEMPWRMITAVDVTIVKPDDSRADRYFVLYHLNSESHLGRCERRASGATRPRIAKRDLVSLPILIPPPELQHSFREVAEIACQMRAKLYRENNLLRAARDLLLPRLMSGEIAV